MARPILSIVIPSRNRYRTLGVLVRHILAWNEKDIELVVQDNSTDTSEFQPALNEFRLDPRFSYEHIEGSLSAIENCDFAISRATGEYICFLGDDDGIISQAVWAARWMKEKGADSLLCQKPFYTWPDVKHAVSINALYNGALVCKPINILIDTYDAAEETRRVFRNGAQDMLRIPRAYHGIVSHEALQKVQEATGSYFPGPVPDMANAVALSKFIHRAYWTDLPLITSGQSANSMAGRNAVRQHQGEIGQIPSLPKSTAERWDMRVPFYWSAPTIWAEAALKAAAAVNLTELPAEFGFSKLYAGCIAFNDRRYIPRVFKAMGTHGSLFFVTRLPVVAWNVGLITLRRFRVLIKKHLHGVKGSHYEDIGQAMKSLELNPALIDQLKSTFLQPTSKKPTLK